jgi:putative transposase
MDEKPETRPMGQVIQIDEARIRDHLGEMVRGTVEEALNAMLAPRRTGCAAPGATSAAKRGRTRAPAAMIARLRRGRARSA